MKPYRVFVVEDESITQSYIIHILKKGGYLVVGKAVAGAEAVRVVGEAKPDLVLMDIMLEGEMDGIEAARWIKKDQDIPILFLTAYSEEEIIQRAATVNPLGYLTKPFKENDLLTAVRIAILRHDLEMRLKTSEHKFRTLFEGVPDAIIITAPDGRLLDTNPAGVRLFGYPDRDTMLRDFNAIKHYENPAERGTFMAQMEQEKSLEGNPYLLRRLDGTVRQVLESSVAECNAMGEVLSYRAILHDVSDRVQREKNLEQVNRELAETNQRLRESQGMLFQQEKMASIGQLAAGVAHELNNPIGFISSNLSSLGVYLSTVKAYVGMLESALAPGQSAAQVERGRVAAAEFQARKKIAFILGDVENLLQESLEGAERVTAIVRNLRNFSRIDYDEIRAPYDLQEGVESTLLVARNEVKYVANVVTEFGQTPLVPCVAGEINQVILNLVVNAAQAIKEQPREGLGTITVTTWAADGYVHCRVADNGPGIRPEHLSKVLDPFFTTKDVGKGTGLGLSISYNIIVHNHGGRLAVESRFGEGAAFTMSLPLSPENLAPAG